MQALAIFKNERLAPVSYIANIRGRGIRIFYAYSYGGGDKLIEQIINDYLKKNKD